MSAFIIRVLYGLTGKKNVIGEHEICWWLPDYAMKLEARRVSECWCSLTAVTWHADIGWIVLPPGDQYYYYTIESYSHHIIMIYTSHNIVCALRASAQMTCLIKIVY